VACSDADKEKSFSGIAAHLQSADASKESQATTNHTQPLALSVDDFATSLAVTPALIRKLLMLRKIAFAKVGRRTVIPVSELHRLLAENLVPANPVEPCPAAAEQAQPNSGSTRL
jgi:hypothetical protein